MTTTPGYREPAGQAAPEPTPRFYVVWPHIERVRNRTGPDSYKSVINYCPYDTLEEAQRAVEALHKQAPNDQSYIFYGHMCIPSVTREVIETVNTTFKVV